MMKYENIKRFCEQFCEVIKCSDLSEDDEMWLKLWETMYALAVIKDIGDLECARKIGDRIIAICEEY